MQSGSKSGNATDAVSRRVFLSGTMGAAAGLAAPYVIGSRAGAAETRPAAARVSPNDKIRIGLIGANGQGKFSLDQLMQQPDAVITAVCEVFEKRRDEALAKCNGTAKPYGDYRKVLENKDIDAVVIATPPHWHALMAIEAAEAGKDFYLEKPMTLTVGECLAVHHAVQKYKRITQVGTQVHATANYRRIVDVVRSGILGPISMVRVFHVLNQGPEGIGRTPPTPVPQGLDWEMWLGPGPKRPFHPLLFKNSEFHPSFMAYSGGWTPGMAPHLLDLPYWALDLGHPTCTSSTGGRYIIDDDGDAYDFQQIQWQFPKLTVCWWTSLVNSFGFDTQGQPGVHRRRGIYFHGTNGTLIADYGYLKIVPEGDRMEEEDVEKVEKVTPDSPGHHREWLDGIRTRTPPSCHVGYHYKVDMAINLGMLSLKLGRSVQFDPVTETIPNDPEAQKHVNPVYREPWRFPAQYV
ncbi:MAG TPA: Gfo/Idh/MocA family oxidoreductase [Phycisphaerae bacterium]|nr:Gfo/Idh/MocA family oxidoreductase [Phycisphaerae bacterium]HRR86908.1 Gfo/Idh/MocA family oxidoreductase [Phycisphaerae bacterium]